MWDHLLTISHNPGKMAALAQKRACKNKEAIIKSVSKICKDVLSKPDLSLIDPTSQDNTHLRLPYIMPAGPAQFPLSDAEQDEEADNEDDEDME
jgi:hypothetical protein